MKKTIFILGLIFLLFMRDSTSSCPQLCEACNGNSCTACYNNFQDSANIYLSSSCPCPTGYFLQTVQNVCNFCPIYCTSCTNYTSCTNCISGYEINNKNFCVRSRQNTKHWISNQISYDLTNTHLVNSLVSGFLFVNATSSASINTYFQYCQGMMFQQFFGLYPFGWNTQLFRSYFGLPYHQWVQIRFQFVAADNWNHNSLILQINGQDSYILNQMENISNQFSKTYTSSSKSISFCLSSYPDNLGIMDASFSHSNSMIKVRIKTSLDGIYPLPDNANYTFFGIRQVLLRTGTCPRFCKTCTGPTSCTQCQPPTYLAANGSCACNLNISYITSFGCQQKCQDGFIYITTLQMCSLCQSFISKCHSCVSQYQCLICNQGSFLYNGLCYRSCPIKYQASLIQITGTNNTKWICIACPNNCTYCLNQSCQLCSDGYYFMKGQCVISCPQKYFIDLQKLQCLECPQNCQTCSSSYNCITCIPNNSLTLIGGKCTLNCSFLNCKNTNCSSNCISCSGDKCNQCSSSKLLQNFECVSNCNPGYYQVENLCKSCIFPCLVCKNDIICQNCANGYVNYFGTCQRKCPIFFYLDINSTCQRCSQNCLNCYNLNTCFTCKSGFVLQNGSCFSSLNCETNKFFDQRFNYCENCPQNCTSCYRDECYSCSIDSVLDNGKCLVLCNSQKIPLMKKITLDNKIIQFQKCEWKDPLCKTYQIINSTYICRQCIYMNPALVLIQNANNTGKCDFVCPISQVKIILNQSVICQNCSQYCMQCDKTLKCLRCDPMHVINPLYSTGSNLQQCISTCPSGFMSDGFQCASCIYKCATCQLDGKCLSCVSGYILLSSNICALNNTCNGYLYYNSSTGACNNCSSYGGCNTCTQSYYCSSCISNKYLQGIYCQTACNSGYFVHASSYQCRPCSKTCAQCIGFQDCTSCYRDYYLLANPLQFISKKTIGLCVQNCPSGYYNYNPINPNLNISSCQFCSSNCLTCYGPLQFQCLTCYGSFKMDHSTCMEFCPSNKYADQFGHCDWCHPSCLQCTGPAQFQCISCLNNSYLYRGQCWTPCPAATFPANYDNRICDDCQWGCAVCSSPYFCYLCFGGFFLHQGWCYLQCPYNTYPVRNGLGMACDTCANVWIGCNKCSSSGCMSCQGQLYLYSQGVWNSTLNKYSYCLSNCPIGYFKSLINLKQCLACPSICTSCLSISECTSCINGYILDQFGLCTKNCPLSTFYNGNSCQTCPINCRICTNSTNCIQCQNGYYIYILTTSINSLCRTSCPIGYYADINGLCSKCYTNCNACTSFSNCTNCSTSTTLSNGFCIYNNTQNCNDSNCAYCLSSTTCQFCMIPYYLYINSSNLTTCLSYCPNGYYQIGRICQKCNLTCLQCDQNLNNCSSCIYGLFLFNNKCFNHCPSGYYANSNTSVCSQCLSGCYQCIQEKKCLQCTVNYFLYENKCYSICPQSTYQSGLSCLSCGSNCRNCIDQSICISCQNNFYKLNNSCVYQCPTNYYISNQNYACLPCVYPCQVCISQAICTICLEGYTLNNNKCQQNCSKNYYSAINTDDSQFCKACPTQCQSCNNQQICTSCVDNFYLIDGNCSQMCPITTFQSNGICKRCTKYCLQCTQYQCTLCNNATILYNNTCITVCPLGTYSTFSVSSSTSRSASLAINTCGTCSNLCLTCNGSSAYNCLSCQNNYYLINSTCLSVCPNGFYGSNQDYTCKNCMYGCAICSSFNQCQQCNSNFTLTSISFCNNTIVCTVNQCRICSSTNICAQCLAPYSLYKNITTGNSTCVLTCPTMTYQNNQFICTPCSSNCISCTNLNCLTCIQNYYLYQGICVSKCPVGFQTQSRSQKCVPSPCLYSNSNGDCIQCLSPYFLQQGQCVLTCSDSYYIGISQCLPCSDGCKKCNNSQICYSCSQNYFYLNGKCFQTCPNGYYQNSNQSQSSNSLTANDQQGLSCILCQITNCFICQSLSKCTQCIDSTFLFNGSCFYSCPTLLYYLDQTSGNCQSCQQNCQKCSNATTCYLCSSTTVLFNGDCFINCPDTYYMYNSQIVIQNSTFNNAQCLSCSLGCQNCSNNQTCNFCSNNYNLYQTSSSSSICVKICPIRFYSTIESTCAQCPNNCLTCDSINCFSCSLITNLFNGKCINYCPNGYFSLNSQCLACSPTCFTCVNSSINCLSCLGSLILDGNGNCVQNCTYNTQYLNSETKQCKNCSSDCLSCFGPQYDDCTSCNSPLVLYQHSCVLNCPADYFISQDNNCQKCDLTHCQTCQSFNDCTSCNYPLVLVLENNIGKCAQSCPPKMFYNTQTKICQNCQQNCLNCISADECLVCVSNFTLYSKDCLNQCPFGYAIVYSQNINVCQSCPIGCLNCTFYLNNFDCNECYSSLYLYEGQCFINCPIGSYLTLNNQCSSCISPCKTCQNLTNCLSCLPTYFFYNNTCISSCPINYIAINQICIYQQTCSGYLWVNNCLLTCPTGTYSIIINSSKLCQSCSISCLSCTSDLNCISCASGTYLLYVNSSNSSSVNQNQAICVSSCPLSTYLDNNQCINCLSPCNQCSLSNGQVLCITCVSNYYLFNGKCLIACPNGYYHSSSNQNCITCFSQCLTCNQTGCITCSNSLYTPPSCSGNCSAGTYWSSTSSNCSNCYTSCATCYGPSSTQCNTCKNVSGIAYYLYGSQCLTICPTGYYTYGLICYPCLVANCQTCINNNSVANCSVCNSGYGLVYSSISQTFICTITCQQLNNSTTTYLMINNTCVSCQTITNCSQCVISNSNLSCVKCKTNSYLYLGKCYSICPNATYAVSQNCYNCQNNCRNCTDSNICTLCASGYFLFNNNCLQSCPSGTYSSNQQCINCSQKCATCNSTQCLTCQSPYALDSNKLCTTCQNGYYLSSQTCLVCNSNCLQCSISSTNCTKCPIMMSILSNKCYFECPSNYRSIYINNVLNCQLCSLITSNCQTCDNNGCISCSSFTYSYIISTNNSLTCVFNCPSDTFVDTISQSCKTCSLIFQNCLTCNSQYCTECAPNYYLLNSVCYSICPIGYYSNNATLTCNQCNTGCKSCSSLLNCLICQNNLANDNNGTCSSKPNNCSIGQYLNSFNSCILCDSSCLTCYGSLRTNCLSCQAPQFTLQADGTCISTCSIGYYFNITSNKCQSCILKFANCSNCNSTNCLSCQSGFLLNGQCVIGCSNGTYLYNQQCLNCPQNCNTCNSSTYCSNCSSAATIYYNNLCYTVCPSSSYSNGTNSCSPCISPCLTCSSATNCSLCASSNFYYNFTCLNLCPNNTYTSGNTCINCPTNCTSCTSSLCTNCSTNFVLYNGTCSTNCPSQYYASTSRICIICPTGCQTCLSASNCQSCINGYAYISTNNSCQNSCGGGKYFYTNTSTNTSTCINCQISGCISCNQTVCFKCNSTLYSIVTNSIITNCTNLCPSSYFKNTTSMNCDNCLANCYQCSNSFNCTQCNSGFVLFNSSQCLITCPIKYFSVTLNGISLCQRCGTSCNYCLNSSVCTECTSPKVLLSGQCIDNCPSGYYLDTSNNECYNCSIQNCQNCSSVICYKCKSGYYGIININVQQITNCTTTCPIGSYADSSTRKCINCLTNCNYCTNSTRCITCMNRTALFSNSTSDQCLNACPSYYYWNGSYPSKCLACGSNCLSCQNSTICYECQSGYSIFYSNQNQICVQNCPNYYYSLNNSASISPYCVPCGLNCIICTDNLTCIQCSNPSLYTLVDSKCIPENCVNCHDCDLSMNPPICANCTNPYFLYHDKCIDYCPYYHYQNTFSTYYKCSKCIQNCLICSDNSSCTQCIPNYVYTNQTGCIDQAVLIYGNLANMSSFTSNITQTVATIYLSSSAGPMAFGEMSNTYFNIQFTQFLFFHEGATGGNPQMSNFLQSLQVMSLTSGGQTTNTTDPTQPPARRRRRLQQSYTSNFIQVNAPIFAMMFGFLGVYLFIVLFQKYLQESCRSSCSRAFLYVDQICTFMQKRFKWIYFDFIMWISYLPFLYFSLLQLKNINFSNFANGISSLLAIIIIVVYPLYPVFIIYLLKKDYFKLAYDTDLYKEGPPNTLTQMSLRPYVQKVKRPIHVIDEDLVQEQNLPQIRYFTMDNFRLIYNPLKYLRKFIFVLIVIAIQDPITLVSTLVALNVLFIVYMFALRPRIMPYLAFDFVIQFVLLFFQVFLLTYLILNGASISIMSILAHGIGFLTANLSLVIAIILNLIAYYKIFQCIKDLIVHLKTKAEQVEKKQTLKQKDLKQESSSIQYANQGQLNLNDKELDNGKRKKINDDSLTEEDDQSIRLSSNGKQLARDLDEKQLVFNGIDPVQYAKQFSNIDDDLPNLKLSQGKIKDKKKGSTVNQQSSQQSQMGNNSKLSMDDDQLYLVKDINKKKNQEDKYKKSNTKTKVQDVKIVQQTGDKYKKQRRSRNNEKNISLSPNQDSQVSLNINTNNRFNQVQQSLQNIKINKGNSKKIQQNSLNQINTYDRLSNKKVSDVKQAKTYEKANNVRQIADKKFQNNNEIQNNNMYERAKIEKKKSQQMKNQLLNRDNTENKKITENLETFNRNKQKNSKQTQKKYENQNNLVYQERQKNKNNKITDAFEDFEQILGQKKKSIQEGNIKQKNKVNNKNQQKDQRDQWDNIQSVELKNKAKNQQKNKYYKNSDEEDNQFNEIKTKNVQRKQNSNNVNNFNQLKKSKQDQIQQISTKNRNPIIKNKLFKDSQDETQQIGEVRTKEVSGNKFKRKQKKSDKNLNQQEIQDGTTAQISTKRKQKNIQKSNQKKQKEVDQGQTIQIKGKKKTQNFNQNKKHQAEPYQLEQGQFKDIKSKNLLNLENKIKRNILSNQDQANELEQGEIYNYKGNKAQKRQKSIIGQSNPFASIDTEKSIVFKKGNKFVNNNEFQQQQYEKRKTSQSKKIASERDNGLKVNQGLEESYEDVIKRNKEKLRLPQKKKQFGTLNLNEIEEFQQTNFDRPKSKIERPSSRSNKDSGLGINSQNNFSDSQDVSRQIRKQRNSARQRINKKSNLKVQEKSNQLQQMMPQDSKRSSIVNKKRQLKSGILQIQDFSEDQNIESIQL